MTAFDGGLRLQSLRWVGLGLCTLLALALGVISLQRNLQRACELHEWPDFSSCPVPDEAVPAQVRDLRARIAWHLHCVERETLPRVAELCGCSRATAHRRIVAAQTAIAEVMGHE